MSALPPIDRSLLPADVRQGTKAQQQTYATAMAFERQLVAQLTKQLADTAKPATGDDDPAASAATSAYRQMLPDALADAITQSGGLGLARSIYDNLREQGA